MPVGASWASTPNFNNYVPQPPQQFQQFPPSPSPLGTPGYQQNQYQQYPSQHQLQNQLQHEPNPPPLPQQYIHQPQIQNVFASPIITPANNPQTFQSAQLPQNTVADRRTGMPVLGSGAQGVDLMTRILMALKSQIQSEEDWALAALMQVSFNSPKACNLRIQSTLADTVLKRIHSRCLDASANTDVYGIEVPYLTGKTVKEQQKVLEALLVLRNTSFDPENAQFLAHSELCRYIIVHGIGLPDMPVYAEFKHMCLEILEAVSFHIKFESAEDPLFQAVVNVRYDSSDRSIIVPALRSLARFLIRDENNTAQSLSLDFITQILRYLLIEDEELITASLDFLYQYTARRSNIPKLITSISNSSSAVAQVFVRLLTFGMSKPKSDYIRLPRLAPKAVPANPPVIPSEILDELLALAEPARATQWIRSSYESEETGEVTQISLWKAYEAQFENHARSSGVRLLPAVDFIKNVTSAFQNSAAMVVNLPGGQKRFIIKGIIPREVAVPPSTTTGTSAAATPGIKESTTAATENIPPSFGPTAALVLQNIGRSAEGKKLLSLCLRDLVDASFMNQHVQPYIQDLMELIDAPVEQDEGDINEEV